MGLSTPAAFTAATPFTGDPPFPSADPTGDGSAPLSGVRVVELSSFVASPLCGLTLAQLGAEVIRIDPIGGAADTHRWPIAAQGDSIYWTGLNRGKRSVVADLRDPGGQALVRRLVIDSGDTGGILVTNSAGREWMSHERIAAVRPDVITLEISGRFDGNPAVDYTVNAALGFPYITGPVYHAGVVNHVLPAWDVACGFYAALAVTAAIRRRELTGAGSHIRLPLENVALSVASTLGYLTEPQLGTESRPRTGNDIYGTYGTDFLASDGGRFMVVALTRRHFSDLMEVTRTTEVVRSVESMLSADFRLESDRFTHREVLSALFATWFRACTSVEVTRALESTSLLYERYRTFDEVVASGELEANPLFAGLKQPGVGDFLASGSPASFNGFHYQVGPAPKLGSSAPAWDV